MKSALDAALGYAERRWPVFPLHGVRNGRCTCGESDCKDPGKHPVGTLVPNGLKNATINAKAITVWWTRCPGANIGIRYAAHKNFFHALASHYRWLVEMGRPVPEASAA